MKIHILYPESNARSSGNQVTAERWCGILAELGHAATSGVAAASGAVDVVIALNAAKTEESLRPILRKQPHIPLLYAVTGTDLHGSEEMRRKTLELLARATAIICINPLSKSALPAQLQARARVILQSAPKIVSMACKRTSSDFLLVGHLRQEKDPLLILKALTELSAFPQIRVKHFGGCLDPSISAIAERASNSSSQYTWFAEVSAQRIAEEMSHARALIITSRTEGAPVIISEAIGLQLPILASNIPGCRGLLGESYPALFPVGDSKALANLVTRSLEDERWYTELQASIVALQPLFTREREIAEFQALFESMA